MAPNIVLATEWATAALNLYALRSKTMIPLRLACALATALSLASALMHANYPMAFFYTVALPVNLVRLAEMLRLIADSKTASRRPAGFDWLKPFMQRVEFPEGRVLFRKGDAANEVFLIGGGEVYVPEHDVTVRAGSLIGEISMLTNARKRTATAICRTPVRAWRASFDEVEQLCLQSPQFSLHLMRIIAQRYHANLMATSAGTASLPETEAPKAPAEAVALTAAVGATS